MKKIYVRAGFFALLLSLFFAVGQSAQADETAIIQNPVNIPLNQTQHFDLGKIPKSGTVLLTISSRMDSTGLGGSNMMMQLRLNGREIEPAISRTAVRMVNKPMTSPVSEGVSGDWYSEKLGGWRVIYAPDFSSALRQKFYADNPYTIVLDVTDLIDFGKDNSLEIINTAKDTVKKFTGKNGDLVIGQLAIQTTAAQSPMTQPLSDNSPIINRGEPAAGAAVYQGEILPGGGFVIKTGKSTFRFNSAFSYPNAGFNSLVAGPVSFFNQKNWSVKVDSKSNQVIAQGADYRIHRTIKFEKTHVEIEDAITNLHSDAPLGIAVRDEMPLDLQPYAPAYASPQIRLAGNPDPKVNDYYAPGNPSVHVRFPDSGIGMIAEDEVFRNQARLYANPGFKSTFAVAGIKTEMLRLAPSETYTLRWAVYPVAGPDYYDFVNLVRDDWDANFTVPGAWWWGYLSDNVLKMSVPELHDFLVHNGIHYANFDGGWIDRLNANPRLGFGAGVYDDYWIGYRKRIRAAAEKLHQALPGIKVLGYYDVNQDSGENSEQKFADSLQTNVNGEPVYGEWEFPGHASTKFYSTVPTLQNNFGKAALSVAQKYMDDMKLDGLYWDEMDNNTYGRPRITYNNFDGHSCQLDPKTWTIVNVIGITPLLSAPFRTAVIDAIQQRGGTILGNTPTGNLKDLHTGIFRMVEIQNNDVNHYQGNLETPLGYIGTHNSWNDFLRALNFAMLPIPIMPRDKTGAYVNLDSDILPYLFPFTPIELHAGYLLGKERIIVTHDGNYGWQDDLSLVISRHFDGKGKLTDDHFATQITSNGARTKVLLGENEAAVLEKIPARFAPVSKVLLPNWNASVTVTKYDEAQLSLKIDAPQGGILTVSNGLFPIQNGRTMDVFFQQKNANSGLTKRATAQSGTLAVNVPEGFEGIYTIKSAQ